MSFEKIDYKKLQKELEELQNKNKELESELENKNKEFKYLQNKVNRYQKTEKIPDRNA
jgi:predicted RNase H-like nuclease (RuvC/YqgF family)